MKIIKLQTALKRLPKLNDEIRYRNCIDEKQFTSGLIAFRPYKASAAKQISHHDKDVVCHVVKGRGRLRVNRRRIALRPGTICHIPRGTPHDFAATKNSELVLFYSLIKTG
ncbi:MAG: cupin domain-containing protein [Candidatus Binatia bacterium]|jgi:mannose-6-phosphate isomerase-like protein (cupin superfamily)